MEHSKLIVSKAFCTENPIIIGIDVGHSFVTRTAKNEILPITEETAVYLLRLLGIEYHKFCQEIEEMVKSPETKEGEGRITSQRFPFDIIVRAALISERDYWIELAIPWLKEIGKNHFVEIIRDIQKNKRVSQRVRHLLLKL